MFPLRQPCGRQPAGRGRKPVLLACLVAGLLTPFLVGWTGKQVDIYADGQARQVTINQWLVGDFQSRKQENLRIGDWILPLPGGWFWPGLKLFMARGTPVAAEVAGENIWPREAVSVASELLAREGITLGPRDRVETNLGSEEPRQYIRVIRVEDSIEVQQQPVDPPVVRRPDRYLAPGQEKVVQEGQPGVRYYKYQVRKENGVEIERRLLETWVEIQPTPKIIAYGSRDYLEVSARAGDTLMLIATAYTHTGNRTATGIWPYRGVVAVDPQVIPLGTRLYVEGYGYAVAQDTGGLIKGNRIDLFMDSEGEAIRWGRRPVIVRILDN
ncbi:cell wall-binding protein YocH precursor [Moorella thermoacetica]|uniref:Cell wall-binding protein YocH n=1 Tax=Neomoorella thermoacetica TaxID=1525 RepID=A0A1J5NVI0_NEOTH|nr:cell wall-binding protein YocH precursor [Moorella thermoacetica]